MGAINRHGYAAGQQITKRLDALGNLRSGCFGVSWWFVRVHLIAGGAWAMAAAQTMLYIYMGRSVLEDFPEVKFGKKALLMLGATMLGAFVGALSFGCLADARGRKFALLIAFVVTHAAGALSAVSPSADVLLTFRFIVGIGLGGQQPTLLALIMELAPTKIRGRALVYLEAFWPFGTIFVVVVSREIEPSIGWRAVSGLSALAFCYLPLLCFGVPESPKWLATSGRIDESVHVLRQIERASSVFHGEDADDAILNLAQPDDENEFGTGAKYMIQTQQPTFCRLVANHVRILLRFPYLSRTLMLWFVWTGMAMGDSAIGIYLDDNFVRKLPSNAERELLLYGVLAAQLLGNLSASALIDRIGRRYSIICFLLLASVGSILQAYLEPTTLTILLTSCGRNFAFMGAWGCLFAYTPELYPISVRVIGIGYAWGISRVGAFVGPQVLVWMGDHVQISVPTVMWVFCSVAACNIVLILLFGIETATHDAERAVGAGAVQVGTNDDHSDNLYLLQPANYEKDAILAYQKHDDDNVKSAAAYNPAHFI